MSTLNVTNLKNITAGVTNVSLLADGSTALVLDSTGTSRTGGIRYNAGTLEVYNGGAWVSAGGGSGTVTGVTASAPLSSSGGAAPNISLTGVVPIANGGTGASTAQGAIDAILPSQGGNAGKYLTTNGTTTSWSATPLNGPASLAEAAAGTITDKYSSPQTAVPKSSSGMTGYAILPSSGAAPTTTAYLHYNTTSNHLEYFAASAAKTALEREGDNMTGKLSVTPSAITAGAGNWNLATSNYWTLGAVAVPLPTGMVAGQGGLIQVTAVPTSWPAAGGVLKYAGGTAPVIATVPAIIPYYSDGTNVYLGKATEDIS
jgi:hypothetical protein